MSFHIYYYSCVIGQLGGHLLACADEDGSVTLCDTRKRGPRSVIKGKVIECIFPEGRGVGVIHLSKC